MANSHILAEGCPPMALLNKITTLLTCITKFKVHVQINVIVIGFEIAMYGSLAGVCVCVCVGEGIAMGEGIATGYRAGNNCRTGPDAILACRISAM
jgi:hypothetical protein